MTRIDWKNLGFDAYRTRTVIRSCFRNGEWSAPEATEEFSFTFDPFSQVLHYAISCFEGLKAFRHKDGSVALFRPDRNAARMRMTANYLGMPCPDEDMFIRMCEECVKKNLEFLPPYGYGASMYVRPLLIGIHPQMQLVPYPEALFAVMCAASRSSCTSAPFLPRLSTSMSIRWLSVPPETRRTPPFCRVSASTAAFFTIWWA